MRDLIKRILTEHIKFITESDEDVNVIKKLENYEGNNNFFNSLKSQIKRGVKLTTKQIDAVKKSSLFNDNWDKENELLKNKGNELYKNIINSNKKDLFQNKDLVSQPSVDWYNKNLTDLDEFYLKLKNPPKSITQKYGEIKTKLIDKGYYGFIEDGNWSILNKFNTNYRLWRELIDETYINSNLTFLEKINDFFKQKPINEIYPELKIEKNIDIKTFSLAEKEIIKDINENSSQKIVNVINKTTGEGNEIENRFKEYLEDKEIIDFSSPGNVVDMEFGTDLMVHNPEGWVPVQVKSNRDEAKKCLLLKLGINGVAVYPDNTGIFRQIKK
jgi:hypothetical protein